MKFREFIKDKILAISMQIFILLTIEIFLLIYPVGQFIKIYIPLVIIIAYIIQITVEYIIKKNYYENIIEIIDELEEKYLITELIKTPSFEEGKILKKILGQVNKSMIENVNKYKYLTQDYKEYIELWIHEIKTPIAASKLIIENNKNATTKSIEQELEKVENYIEQALYYARSSTVEKDYYIRKNKLREIVNEVIKKNKNQLIQRKISVNIHDVDVEVNTDNKWSIFILNQIILNSIKYMKKNKKLETVLNKETEINRNIEEKISEKQETEINKNIEIKIREKQEEETNGKSEIEIYAKAGKENIILYIKDNGIGIKHEEITKVFEKGFTGTNGREQNKKSTGIGLYLCKKLCNKLGMGIELNSIQEQGTEVKLIFPKNSYIDL